MRKVIVIFFSFSFSFLLAQVPEGYYQSAIGKSGEELRIALFGIINDHTELQYSELWNAFTYTDVMPSENVWDMYSDLPDDTAAYYFTFFEDQCGNYSQEGDCYNREHTVPKSWFSSEMPMKTDLFHLYPTDGWVNNKRSNFPYGQVSNPTWISTNGSKLGPCTYIGYTGTVFEPIDAYKGDLARSYFYMTVRYMDKNLGQDTLSVFNGSQLLEWAQNMFMDWHIMDPVSSKEIERNDVIYNHFQHNRNPFIDCPELVDYLFGDKQNEPWNPTCVDAGSTDIIESDGTPIQSIFAYPNPANHWVTIDSKDEIIKKIDLMDMSGKIVKIEKNVEGKQCKIDVSTLVPGLYWLHIHTNQKVSILKLEVY